MKTGGYMRHIISNAKDQLKHVFPYINYKKEKVLFSKYAQRLLSYFYEKNQSTLLFLSYITVIITTCL